MERHFTRILGLRQNEATKYDATAFYYNYNFCLRTAFWLLYQINLALKSAVCASKPLRKVYPFNTAHNLERKRKVTKATN